MLAFGILLAFAGIIVLIAGAAQAAQNRSYAACSEAVTGRVIRKQSRNVRHGKSHELTVVYTVDGTEYKKVVGALLTEFQAVSEGDEIGLLYKPGDPKKAVRPGALKPRNVKVALIVGAVMIIAGAAMFYIGRM